LSPGDVVDVDDFTRSADNLVTGRLECESLQQEWQDSSVSGTAFAIANWQAA